jgi:hypothetical protein
MKAAAPKAQRPLGVTVISLIYIVAGIVGLAFHPIDFKGQLLSARRSRGSVPFVCWRLSPELQIFGYFLLCRPTFNYFSPPVCKRKLKAIDLPGRQVFCRFQQHRSAHIIAKSVSSAYDLRLKKLHWTMT